MTAYSSGDDEFDRHWNVKNGCVNPDGSRGPAWDNPRWREERERTMAALDISPSILAKASTIMQAMIQAGLPPAGVSYHQSDHPQDEDRFEVKLALGGGTAKVLGEAHALVALFERMAERRRRMRKGATEGIEPTNTPAAPRTHDNAEPRRDREPTGRQRP